MKVKYSDLNDIYNSEVKKNVKNKEKIYRFERNKVSYLCNMKRQLESLNYNGGVYNIFLVFKPKVRVVMSQSIYDKVINHYITRFILLPKLTNRLVPENCATRKNMGLLYGLKMVKKLINYYKRSGEVYYLKMDISKYFYSIDQDILLSKVKKFLTEEEYILVKNIIYSTNKNYVNKNISYLCKKYNVELPKYDYKKGLPIGNMTSQFLAIFYLNELHFYIKHTLKLSGCIYMDDYVYFSNNKEYLNECFLKIKSILNNDYKLTLNTNKTFIKNVKDGLNFLGYNFYIKNNKTIIKLSKSTRNNIKKGIKRCKYNYINGIFNLSSAFSSIENYMHSYVFIDNKTITNYLNRYW
mgnify:FL=1